MISIFSDWLYGFIGWYLGNRFQRGLKRKPMALIKKLRKAVSSCVCVNEFRDMWNFIWASCLWMLCLKCSDLEEISLSTFLAEAGGSFRWEARACKDTSSQHDHCTRDDWKRDWCVQWQDLQPGWDQGMWEHPHMPMASNMLILLILSDASRNTTET
jgi:hypothetical protein